MSTMRTVTILYMDGKKDVLERSPETPSTFVDGGVLNIKGRYHGPDEFTWFYYPLCNIRNYATNTIETTEIQKEKGAA